jgi:hypothetical protein
MRFPHLAHRSAAAHKLHSTPQQHGMNLVSGNGETNSRLPTFSLFLPGSCPNNRDRRTVEFIEGDLGHVQHDRTVHVLSHDEASFYCELRYIESARQYKSGWAAHQFKSKFGRFPPWSWNNHQPRQPSPATIAWVRSRQIAYAKALRP